MTNHTQKTVDEATANRVKLTLLETDAAMTESHLYAGFRYAGFLGSIRTQREIQEHLLHGLQPERLLVVGCAQGDELSKIVSNIDISDPLLSVTAIDLCDVKEQLFEHSFAGALGERFKWVQLDLLKAGELPGYGEFDVVQCGFVLHDIPWELKDRATTILSDALKPGGHLLISEIVAKPGCDYISEIADIYDVFINEATASLSSGLLNAYEYRLFVGDGVTTGLRRSKADAIQGGRDYFDTLAKLVERAENLGLQTRRIIRNSLNDRLIVAVFKRANRHLRQPQHQD